LTSRPGRIFAAAVLLLLLPAAVPAPATGAEKLTPEQARARYLELLSRKQAADKEASLWNAENELASKRTAYAVLDLSDRTIEFRVRGFAFKKIRFSSIDLGRGSSGLGVSEVPKGAFTLTLKEGRGVETESLQLKTLTPDEARRAGIKDEDTETLGAEQGEIAEGAPEPAAGAGKPAGEGDGTAKKMTGVAGGSIPPDPPPSYHMGFENNVSVLVVADRPIAGDEAKFAWIVDLGKRIGRWFQSGAAPSEVRITLRMPLADGQSLYRQLLPGQRLIITA
jgi:hypothetical protein